MRRYTIKKVDHIVYDSLAECPEDLQVRNDWKKSNIGDWIQADDGAVMQVLRKGLVRYGSKDVSYIGTCTGTYLCRPADTCDGNRRKNIYSFSGEQDNKESVRKRKKVNVNEVMFAKFIAHGMTPVDAYIKAFKTMNRKYALSRSALLVKQERIIMAVKEELDGVFTKLGINLEYLIGKAKDELEMSDRGADRLKALSMLWDAAEVVPKQTKVTAQLGAVFNGFDNDNLKQIERPKEYQLK